MGFLRKVYGLLSVQLLMTTLIAGVCLFNPAVRGLIHSNSWLILLAFILSMGLLIALHIKRKESPMNLILLASFVSLPFTRYRKTKYSCSGSYPKILSWSRWK